MERTLYLIRHAPAETQIEPGGRDFDRALTPEGRKLAEAQAQALLNAGVHLDGLIASTALRAWQTADVFSRILDLPDNRCVRWPLLYSAKVQELISMRISKSWNVVGIVAHNPVLSDMAAAISRSFDESIPAAGILGISFPVSQWLWPKTGTIVHRFFPE